MPETIEEVWMYIPAHFAATEQAVRKLLGAPGAADLVTVTDEGLVATLLPFLYDPDEGEQGALLGHVARNNLQWRLPPRGEALVIMRGPDGYVSPSWYAGPAEHGRAVPTWNYVTAHVYGDLVVHDDAVWVSALVRRLTERHEAGRTPAWSVDDAPPDYIAGQLRAIVGVEIRIRHIEAKLKLSQNRPAEDVAGVVDALSENGADELASAVRAARPPAGS